MRSARLASTWALLLATCFGPQAVSASASSPPRLVPASPAPISIEYPDPVSAREIYRAVGKAFGVDVIFDPHLRDLEIALTLEEVTLEEALDHLTRSAGHFYKAVGQATVLVAPDTPRNRRQYTDQVIHLFTLEEADLQDVVTTLRTLVDIQHLAAIPESHALLVRDSAERVEIAARLVAMADRPRDEVELGVEVLAVDGELLDRLAGRRDGAKLRQPPSRLSAEQLRTLKKNAQESLSSLRLGLFDGRSGSLHIEDRLVGSGDGAPLSLGLELEARARIHPQSGEVSLRLNLAHSSLSAGEGPSSTVKRKLESSLRLAQGESYLITGLSAADGAGRELVLVLTPEIMRRSSADENDRVLWVGTEQNLALSGEDQVSSK